MTNYLDPKYWMEPESYLASTTEELIESFEGWAAEGLKPKDIADVELRQKYSDWLNNK
ncbi:MAG: hypothetical protein J0H09_23425 [Burkholderiales bacterium]|nr:hypothetical protein [Burkholderiales bacterium]